MSKKTREQPVIEVHPPPHAQAGKTLALRQAASFKRGKGRLARWKKLLNDKHDH